MTNPDYVDESRPWFRPEAGWPAEVPQNMDFPRMTLYEMLEEATAKYAERPVIWFLDTWMTFAQLKKHVEALAAGLDRLGLKQGDVLALILPNSFQYVLAYYACARLGVIVTGVNPTYKPAEVRHQFQMTGVSAVIALDSLSQDLLGPILADYPLEPGRIVTTNVVDLVKISGFKKWLGKKLGKIPTGPTPPGAVPFLDLLQETAPAPRPDLSPEAPHTYIMTGGTTGVPKAAVLSHFNCVANACQCGAWIFFGGAGFCDVGVLPLFHSFAMTAVMNVSIQAGMWMMLFPRPPQTEELLKTICALAPDKQTFFPRAEVLFQRIADFPDLDRYPLRDKLKCCISGAGPLHAPVQEKFEAQTGAIIVEGYGLTEASPVVCAGPLTDFRTTGTIGLPFPGTDWKIMDMETGQAERPPGEVGELWVAGPQVMTGYLNQPEETAETIREQEGKRWLLTGDIGSMDELGRVTLSDRKKQLIKVKGYSVFPREVEELVGRHPGVSEVAAAGLPDPEKGEIIKVWVVLSPEAKGQLTPEELRAWAQENISPSKVPHLIEFRDELPKTLVGKVMRRTLQEGDPLYQEYHRPQK